MKTFVAPCRTRSNPIRTLDLFAGAGGLTEGFRTASRRFEAVQAVEMDPAAAASFAANHDAKVFTGEIEQWLELGEVPDIDVVVGGPPCQGFSGLGKQEVEDDRNQLWRHYADTIRLSQPKFFVVENVPAFLTSPQFAQFKEQTSSTGPLHNYDLQATVLNAADYGAPQARKRTVLIGHHKDLPFPGFPQATHSSEEWVSVRHAFRGLRRSVTMRELPADRHTTHAGKVFPGHFRSNELHLTRHYEQDSLLRFAYIGPGQNRHAIPDHLLSPCWRAHKTGSGDVMGRLSWDKPSVTIRTEFFKPEKGRYLHPTQHRALTHHEAARLQGFPDRYLWVGSKTSIARQIGNAVPIPLGAAVARQILAAYDAGS